MPASYKTCPPYPAGVVYSLLIGAKTIGLTALTLSLAHAPNRETLPLKMVIAIVLWLALCWIPWSIGVLLLYFARDALPCGFYFFLNIARFMAVSNCAINPCICFIFSTNYRSALKRLLNCLRGATVSVKGAAQRE